MSIHEGHFSVDTQLYTDMLITEKNTSDVFYIKNAIFIFQMYHETHPDVPSDVWDATKTPHSHDMNRQTCPASPGVLGGLWQSPAQGVDSWPTTNFWGGSFW